MLARSRRKWRELRQILSTRDTATANRLHSMHGLLLEETVQLMVVVDAFQQRAFNNSHARPIIRFGHRYPEPPTMPRPPTPVSGCPLKRLEVQDGVQSRVYDSTHFASALTLTLEGQRSVDAECDSLVLLVHSGPRRMVGMGFSPVAVNHRADLLDSYPSDSLIFYNLPAG